jgi:DNA-binding transcriptional LysR family regulator
MKNYAELVSRLRMAALATQTFPTERGRRLRAEHQQMLNAAAEALEALEREATTLRDQIARLVPDRK